MIRLAAITGGDWERWTLRELLWRWQSVTYQQVMAAAMVVAGVFNSQRAKASDKVFTWLDFHPQHASEKRRTGAEIVRKTVDWFPASEVQWLPGYGPEVIQ